MKTAVLFFLLSFILTFRIFPQENKEDITMKADTGYITVDGGKLFYEISGQGDYIVLLHDGILHNVIWDNQVPVLAKNYRVVRYDRRGFGKSSAPEAPFSHRDDLKQLFTQLNIEKAILFGMSAGGAWSINFALTYPDKVKALVLVGAVVAGYSYSNHLLTRGGRINLNEIRSDPEKFIQYFGWDDPYEIYPENVEAKERFFALLKANPQNIKGAFGYMSKPPERPDVKFLNDIKVPTLILAGEYDIPDVHAQSGAIQSGITNAKREIILKAGHLIPFEQPESFNVAVMKFLNEMNFFNILNSQGVTAAVEYFNKIHETNPSIILFDETEMNALGYSFLQDGKIKEAIELFKLNCIAYPNSGNVYDSLGDSYIKDGQKDLAIKNFEKSLELNHDNANAKQMLKKIKELE